MHLKTIANSFYCIPQEIIFAPVCRQAGFFSRMELNSLSAISPVDGRYWNQAGELSAYFSESSLIKYRVLVEVEYFIALCEIPLAELNKAEITKFEKLKNIY